MTLQDIKDDASKGRTSDVYFRTTYNEYINIKREKLQGISNREKIWSNTKGWNNIVGKVGWEEDILLNGNYVKEEDRYIQQEEPIM